MFRGCSAGSSSPARRCCGTNRAMDERLVEAAAAMPESGGMRGKADEETERCAVEAALVEPPERNSRSAGRFTGAPATCGSSSFEKRRFLTK